jgi:hypothetical protein
MDILYRWDVKHQAAPRAMRRGRTFSRNVPLQRLAALRYFILMFDGEKWTERTAANLSRFGEHAGSMT